MLDVIFKWLHIPVHSKRNWISDQPASKMVQCRIVDVTSVEIDASVDVVEFRLAQHFLLLFHRLGLSPRQSDANDLDTKKPKKWDFWKT